MVGRGIVSFLLIWILAAPIHAAGNLGEPCLQPGDRCIIGICGKLPGGGDVCVQCGGPGQYCCDASSSPPRCNFGNQCIGSICQKTNIQPWEDSCGLAGLPTCIGVADGQSYCVGASVPTPGGVCVECGEYGYPCCRNTAYPCDYGSCVNGICYNPRSQPQSNQNNNNSGTLPPPPNFTNPPNGWNNFPQASPPDNLGRIWIITEGSGHTTRLERIGRSSQFNGTFDNVSWGTVTVTAYGRNVTLKRVQDALPSDPAPQRWVQRECDYEGTFSPDFKTASGTMTCNFFDYFHIPHNLRWTANIEQ